MITQLAPLIAKHQGDGTMSAVLLATNDPPKKVQVGNYTLEVARMRRPVAAGGASTARPAATSRRRIFIAVGA